MSGAREERMNNWVKALQDKQNAEQNRLNMQAQDNSTTVNNNYNIKTPDAASFKQSQKQINEEAGRMAEQVSRRQRRTSVMSGMR